MTDQDRYISPIIGSCPRCHHRLTYAINGVHTCCGHPDCMEGDDAMRESYDFSKGERGKYAKRDVTSDIGNLYCTTCKRVHAADGPHVGPLSPVTAEAPETEAGRALLDTYYPTTTHAPSVKRNNLAANIRDIEVQARADADREVERVTRFEVIDHRKDGAGRVFVAQPCSVELSFQDDGRTLKVFVR